QKFFYQGIGTAGVGYSIGYAEKYAHATVVPADPNTPPTTSSVTTSLKVLPMRLMVLYKMDYLAFHYNVPLTPYVKAGLNFTPWWASKGGSIDYVNGTRGAGGKWGYGFTAGLGFCSTSSSRGWPGISIPISASTTPICTPSTP